MLNFKHLERASVSWDSCSYQCKNDLTLPLLNRGKKWGKHSLVDSASRFRSSKKHVWRAQNLNYYWQILKRQLSLLCGILLQKSSTGGENLIDKTELHAWLSHQACRWWHENETLQEVLCLLCFRLTCHTQLVNCASITSWRPTHAHVCAQEELLGWHFIKGSTEEVPAQNATVHSVYLNTGNIQHHVRNSYPESLSHLILRDLSAQVPLGCLTPQTHSIPSTPPWLLPGSALLSCHELSWEPLNTQSQR